MTTSVILFGGTFDPPHVGHLTMAQMALEHTDADVVWFLPSPDPPHKSAECHLDYARRVEMVKALVATAAPLQARFVVSTIEEEMTRPSYTVDTVRMCKHRFPNVRFKFLIGSDSLEQLPTWHKASELCGEIEFLVVPRSQHPFEETVQRVSKALPNLRATFIPMPVLDVSSTWIRDRWTVGKPICGLVPQEVLQFMPKSGD